MRGQDLEKKLEISIVAAKVLGWSIKSSYGRVELSRKGIKEKILILHYGVYAIIVDLDGNRKLYFNIEELEKDLLELL